MTIQIRAAQLHHRPALRELLTQSHLSGDDLPHDLLNFWLAFDDDQLIGSAGIETYGAVGLLRSVCVDADYRSQGIARRLYKVAHQSALR